MMVGDKEEKDEQKRWKALLRFLFLPLLQIEDVLQRPCLHSSPRWQLEPDLLSDINTRAGQADEQIICSL